MTIAAYPLSAMVPRLDGHHPRPRQRGSARPFRPDRSRRARLMACSMCRSPPATISCASALKTRPSAPPAIGCRFWRLSSSSPWRLSAYSVTAAKPGGPRMTASSPRRFLRSPLALLLLLSTFAWAPLLAPGYFMLAHDAHHSLHILVEFDQAIRSGFLWPRLEPRIMPMGYGYPPVHLLLASGLLRRRNPTSIGRERRQFHQTDLGVGLHRLRPDHVSLRPAAVGAVADSSPGCSTSTHLIIWPTYVHAAFAEFVAFVIFPLVLHAFWDLVDPAHDDRPWGRHASPWPPSHSASCLSHTASLA